jgi:hypothetical protein
MPRDVSLLTLRYRGPSALPGGERKPGAQPGVELLPSTPLSTEAA